MKVGDTGHDMEEALLNQRKQQLQQEMDRINERLKIPRKDQHEEMDHIKALLSKLALLGALEATGTCDENNNPVPVITITGLIDENGKIHGLNVTGNVKEAMETPKPTTLKEVLEKKILAHYIKLAMTQIEKDLLASVTTVTFPGNHSHILPLFAAHWKDQQMSCIAKVEQDSSIKVTIRW